ncbi:MAG: FmdB family zinc ribbon protein [Acidimicrobiales bacterium]
MPTYEFRCKSCDDRFEIVRSFTEEGDPACPSCGATDTAKVFGNIAVTFKGSGFYKTDSRGKSSAGTKSDKSEKSEKSESSSSNGESGGHGHSHSHGGHSHSHGESSSSTPASSTPTPSSGSGSGSGSSGSGSGSLAAAS